MQFLLSFLVIFFSAQVFAKTLLVSDVDDTIKLANVQNFASSVGYARDWQSRFMGMSALYAGIVQDNSESRVVYLSRAPKWLMSNIHQKLLKNGSFPEGLYIPRTNYSSDEHKLKSLREVIDLEKPNKVIFVGDNGEADPHIYNQIANEYRSEGIRFYQFIRIVYSGTFSLNKGTALYEGQVGFVTPLEVSLELEKEGLLQAATVSELMNSLGPVLADEKKNIVNREFAFPDFVQCENMKWQWDADILRFEVLQKVKERISRRCGLSL